MFFYGLDRMFMYVLYVNIIIVGAMLALTSLGDYGWKIAFG